MIDTWLLIIIVIVGTVVAIEGMPDGFKKNAKTLVTELVAAVAIMLNRLANFIMLVGRRIGHWIRESHFWPDQGIKLTRPSLRVVLGAAVAVIASPVAAIPMTLVFALLLYALNMIGGDEYSLAANGSGTLRYIVGYAFVILVATLDVISRWFVVALPLLIVLGFITANYVSRSYGFVRNLALSTVLMGGVYPLLFMLAAALDVFHEPIFN